MVVGQEHSKVQLLFQALFTRCLTPLLSMAVMESYLNGFQGQSKNQRPGWAALRRRQVRDVLLAAWILAVEVAAIGQPDDGVQVELFQQFLLDAGTHAITEQCAVWNDDGGTGVAATILVAVEPGVSPGCWWAWPPFRVHELWGRPSRGIVAPLLNPG
jgi:hypothetical protein